jgi:hypothetical protein
MNLISNVSKLNVSSAKHRPIFVGRIMNDIEYKSLYYRFMT